MYMRLARVQYYIFLLILFLLPSNLFLKFSEQTAYVNGILVDYLLPKLFLTDIWIFLLMVITIVIEYKRAFDVKRKKTIGIYVFVALYLLFRSLFAKNATASLSYIFTLLSSGYFCFFLLGHKSFFNNIKTTGVIAFTILFQALLGVYQFFSQHSLFGYLFLGEPTFAPYTQLAHVDIGGISRVLPYGTLPHPNVLAGFLLFYMLFLLLTMKIHSIKKSTVFFAFITISLFLGVFCLLLTYSISAITSLLLASTLFLLSKTKKIHLKVSHIVVLAALTYVVITTIIFITPIQTPNTSLTRRMQLEHIAVSSIREYPLFGIGPNQFPIYVLRYGGVISTTQFLQPVHNIPLLILAEYGVLGIIIFGLFFYFEHNYYSCNKRHFFVLFLPIIVISSLDHYLVTLHQGQLLTAILLAFLIDKKEK